MNAMSRTALNAYAKVQVDTSVEGASPHKLIDLLFEGALFAVSNAKGYMLRKEIAAKGKSISHAIAIIDDGLKNCLDMEVGGELALNLRALYAYMSYRLLQANLSNSVEPLDEVTHLLADLRGAWAMIDKPRAPASLSGLLAERNPAQNFGQA